METPQLNRLSVSEQIFEQLKDQIIKGELKPGERLPSENSLCKLYGVSRTTIRQALANLSSLKLIETRVGEGSFVRNATGADIASPLISQAYFCDRSLLELVELRILVEPVLAAYACEKSGSGDVEDLEQIYSLMEKNKNNVSELARLDCEFHTRIAKSAGNTYLTKIAEIISDILLSAFLDIVAVRGNTEGLSYHRELLDAFKEKKPEKTGQIMKAHMEKMLKSLK